MSLPETTDTYELPLRYRGPGDTSDTYIFCGVMVSTMTVATLTYTDAGASGEFEQENLLSVGDTIPSPPGVASAGTSNKAARADHVHPKEVSNTGVKTQSVAIAGVKATNTATVDHVYTGAGTSDDYAAFVEAENQYLNCITNGYAETYNGGIKFTIFGDANTVAIPIVAEVS